MAKRSLGVQTRKLIRRIRPRRVIELTSVLDRPTGAGRAQEIPRQVFQTAESRLVHPSHAKSIEVFRDLNPGLGFKLFDAQARDQYMTTNWSEHQILNVYNRAILGQMKADIFRYCVVFQHGGYYFDLNKGCGVPLESLHLADAHGLVSYESNPALLFPQGPELAGLQNPFNLVAQWGFGFAPRHPLLRLAIDTIVEIEPFFRDRSFWRPKEALLTMTAPGLFTRVFRQYVSQHGTDGIEEAGEDFHGHGIFRLRGSMKLQTREGYYGQFRNRPIIASSAD